MPWAGAIFEWVWGFGFIVQLLTKRFRIGAMEGRSGRLSHKRNELCNKCAVKNEDY
jgi:hypothetical protein